MKLRTADINGKPGWAVDFGVLDGARRQTYHLDKAEAEKAYREGVKAARLVGKRWTEHPPSERADVVSILREIQADKRGLTLRQVWTAFKTGALANTGESKTLREAIDELLKAKTAANCRKSYVAGLEGCVGRFARGRETLPIASVGVADIEAFIASGSPSSRATALNRVSTFLSFAVRRGWIAANPCDQVERVHVETGIPEILRASPCGKSGQGS